MSSVIQPDMCRWGPTRRTLLSRLKNWGDQDSWQEFFDAYWRLIYTAAVQSGLSETDAEEVVQETVIAVCKKMPGFRYDPARGSFKNWLLRITNWRIEDQRRKREGLVRLPSEPPMGIESIPDPTGCALETIWNQEWEQNLMDAALGRVKRRVDPKQYQIFDLYVLKGWPVGKISQSLGVGPTKIYLAKHRVTNVLKKEIAQLQSRGV